MNQISKSASIFNFDNAKATKLTLKHVKMKRERREGEKIHSASSTGT